MADPPIAEQEPKKYYGVFTAAGEPRGFWVNDVYPRQANGLLNAAIPTNAVEISEATWRALLADPATARYANGRVYHVTPPPLPPPPPPPPSRAEFDALLAEVQKLRGAS
jgi:hypothetical protein